MGIVSFGIPEHETKWLRTTMGLNTVVESGTYQGDTALSLSKSFCTVYTIEKSEMMFEAAKKKLSSIANIHQLQGDTREHLSRIVAENDNILFWIDAHWSGGDTYGEQDECPLLEELSIVFNSSLKNFAILVDDARLFLAPPPLPHNLHNWPTIREIAAVIPAMCDMVIHDDVIYVAPKSVEMPEYMQLITTSTWLKYGESAKPSMKNCLKSLLSSAIAYVKDKKKLSLKK